MFSLIILINKTVQAFYLNKRSKNFQERLKEWEENIDEGGNKKLCRIYLFSINLIENNNKYWNEQLDSLNKLEHINIEITDKNLINCDNEESAKMISTKLLSITKTEENHIFCITWLINNFEEARQFFCGADIEYKDKLVLLIKEEGLLTLEVYYPYVLKLDKMQSSAKLYLYQLYAQSIYNSPISIRESIRKNSIRAEMRIIAEIIFRGFARIEKLGEQNLLENKELIEIIKKKTKWLRQIIFENAFISEEKICLMNR
uniref:Uncharacterized protein n=1 Tax=Meloidogyne enterolobii TaxID=390850 RepID=A0A6V7XNE3_MELEN|nr:unnamed protein product [Meloidogyne enterolobii]